MTTRNHEPSADERPAKLVVVEVPADLHDWLAGGQQGGQPASAIPGARGKPRGNILLEEAIRQPKSCSNCEHSYVGMHRAIPLRCDRFDGCGVEPTGFCNGWTDREAESVTDPTTFQPDLRGARR